MPKPEACYRVTAGCCGPFRVNDVVAHTTAASVGDVPTLIAQGVLEPTQRAVTRVSAVASGDPLVQLRLENEALVAERAEQNQRLEAAESACIRLREDLAREASDRAGVAAQIAEVNGHSATLTQERDHLILTLAEVRLELVNTQKALADTHKDLDAATMPAVTAVTALSAK